jgi:hypothetical protein
MKLRFSIRDLLWLTLVVGMAVGWLLDHKNNAKQLRDSRNQHREEEFRATAIEAVLEQIHPEFKGKLKLETMFDKERLEALRGRLHSNP